MAHVELAHMLKCDWLPFQFDKSRVAIRQPPRHASRPMPTVESPDAPAVADSGGKSAHDGAKHTSRMRTLLSNSWRLLTQNSLAARCARIIVLGTIPLGLCGYLLRDMSSLPKMLDIPLDLLLVMTSAVLFIYTVILCGINGFVFLWHRYSTLEHSSFIYYVSELQSYISMFISLGTCLSLISIPQISTSIDQDLGFSEGISKLPPILSLLLLITAIFAVKSHFMSKMAMTFNFSNYRQRIQESIFADRILNLLQRSRHTYRFRQKWRATAGASLANGKASVTRAPAASPDITVLKSGTVQSMVDLFRRGPATPTDTNRTGESLQSPLMHTTPAVVSRESAPHVDENISATGTDDISAPVSPAQPEPPLSKPPAIEKEQPPRARKAVAEYLTEVEKKQQFAEFFVLANKMLSRFTNLSDYRAEIHAEAERMAERLYKYLLGSAIPDSTNGAANNRKFLLGQDMLPYIDDEDEFCRAITMFHRHIENSVLSTKSGKNIGSHNAFAADRSTNSAGQKTMALEEACSYAITQDALAYAIESILTDVYMTSKSLQTMENALNKVDYFFTGVILLIFVICCAIIGGDSKNVTGAITAVLSGAAFAFNSSARQTFESMIFLLVIHPFDVGDRVFIPLGATSKQLATAVASMAGDNALDNAVVVEMHLLSTVFERWDGVRLYVPNYVLASKPIFNLRRSGAICELQTLHVDMSTPMAKIDDLRRRLEDYVSRESSDFTDMMRVVVESIENCNRMNITIIYQHVTNWQDMDTHLARRSKIMTYIKRIVDDLEIGYLPPVQRVAIVGSIHDVSKSLAMSPGESRRIDDLNKRQPTLV